MLIHWILNTMLADLPCIASTWAEQFPSRSQQPDVYSRIGNKSWPVIMDDQNSPQFKQKGKLIGPDYYECELWLYVISRPIYSSIAFFVLFLHYLWQGVGLLLGLGRISSLKPGYLAMFDWPPFFGWPVKHCPLTLPGPVLTELALMWTLLLGQLPNTLS